jgi:fluoride exporter
MPPVVRLFAATGVLGGYTTFSTFSLEAITLVGEGGLIAAALYTGASVILGFVGASFGIVLTRMALR